MKKIILLVVILFTLTGCYDYTELNDLAIISGVSIDYEDNKYNVAFEVLNVKSTDEQITTEEKTYISKGSSESIANAFSNASLDLAKTPYFPHLKILILSEEVAKEHLEDINDFLLRDIAMRNIFYTVIANGTSAFDLLNASNKNNPIVSNAIKDLIDSKEYVNNIGADLTYEQFIENVLNKNKDGYMSSIQLQDDLLKLGPIAIFDEYKMQTYLSIEESSTLNIMNGKAQENYFQIACPNDTEKYIILGTYTNPKSGIEIKGKTATIKTNIETKVMENHCEYDFKEDKTYEELKNALEEKVEKDMKKTMNTLLQHNSDVLDIQHLYYKKYRKNIDFQDLNFDFKCEVVINKNGLIYEVKNESK